mmetsp:Transcript_903/g.2490  ORF Transcript_903/g.2490 Transcript_903/m.2490 type:complete len:590 (-) Transcript_903:1182-2951(-)
MKTHTHTHKKYKGNKLARLKHTLGSLHGQRLVEEELHLRSLGGPVPPGAGALRVALQAQRALPDVDPDLLGQPAELPVGLPEDLPLLGVQPELQGRGRGRARGALALGLALALALALVGRLQGLHHPELGLGLLGQLRGLHGPHAGRCLAQLHELGPQPLVAHELPEVPGHTGAELGDGLDLDLAGRLGRGDPLQDVVHKALQRLSPRGPEFSHDLVLAPALEHQRLLVYHGPVLLLQQTVRAAGLPIDAALRLVHVVDGGSLERRRGHDLCHNELRIGRAAALRLLHALLWGRALQHVHELLPEPVVGHVADGLREHALQPRGGGRLDAAVDLDGRGLRVRPLHHGVEEGLHHGCLDGPRFALAGELPPELQAQRLLVQHHPAAVPEAPGLSVRLDAHLAGRLVDEVPEDALAPLLRLLQDLELVVGDHLELAVLARGQGRVLAARPRLGVLQQIHELGPQPLVAEVLVQRLRHRAPERGVAGRGRGLLDLHRGRLGPDPLQDRLQHGRRPSGLGGAELPLAGRLAPPLQPQRALVQHCEVPVPHAASRSVYLLGHASLGTVQVVLDEISLILAHLPPRCVRDERGLV